MQWRKIFKITSILIVILGLVIVLLMQKEKPEKITYGMSFNTLYANELGLDWRETYDAILNDLEVRHLRLAAHWPMTEPVFGEYNFEELDYQLKRAEEVGAEVILAVGRRLPRWPECHNPTWTNDMVIGARNKQQLLYMEKVVERYKDNKAIKYWQVENEPFLEVFAFEHCGELDKSFLDKEIALVRELDPSRQIIVTDSGNLGKWYGAYKRGDVFGTSVYVHFWNPELGQFRTLVPAWGYRVKENLMALIFGYRPAFLIELSTEPWLIAPVIEVDIETQLTRMDLEKIKDIIKYAEDTRFEKQYLWGAEWWYWMKQNGHPEIWEWGRELYNE